MSTNTDAPLRAKDFPKGHAVETHARPCDICIYVVGIPREEAERALYDGRQKVGTSWANMCGRHWESHGIGRLGTGFGQRLIVVEDDE